MSGPDYRGFISNAWDTKIMSSYVDENTPNGLKQNSKMWLGYEQTSYDEVTTLTGPASDLPRGGKVKGTTPDGDLIKQYRMNELTAEQVLAYGADDTICTSALFNFYGLIMDLEGTTGIFRDVEVKPAYLTALSYTQGTKVSIQRLKELEREDDKKYEAARVELSEILLKKGYLDKMWSAYTEWNTTNVKDACEELFGFRPETKVRTPEKMAIMFKAESPWPDDENVLFTEFCAAVARSDLDYINRMLLAKYKANPAIDVQSSKKMQDFLYRVLGLPVRITNMLTPLQWQDKPLANAMRKFSKAQMKGETPELTEDEWKLVRTKASGDNTAIEFALLYDSEIDPDITKILKCIKVLKKISTLRGLYYKPYPYLVHWKDGLLHSSVNQCHAVTRRYSMSGPNLQQLPKKGEGVKVRSILIPHHKDAVIVSLDFSGQELRLAAHMSQDPNMLACYIGDNLKDIHSITAAGAMKKKWGEAKVKELTSLVGMDNMVGTQDFEYKLFVKLHKGVTDKEIAKLADDLRKVAKNVNFGAQYDAQALTLALSIIIPVKDAQDFLDAREKMFPQVDVWKDNVRSRVERLGYAMTLMGARRHLGRLLQDRATANKAGRQGPNFEVQGSSAEQTKLAMARVWDSGVVYDYDCRFIAPIHDELVFSIHKDHVVDAVRIIHRCMTEQYHDMKVPCLSSISLGPNFGEQIECGDYFIEENIRKALHEVFHGKKELEAA